MIAKLRRNEFIEISKALTKNEKKSSNSTRDARSKTLIKNSESANSLWREHK